MWLDSAKPSIGKQARPVLVLYWCVRSLSDGPEPTNHNVVRFRKAVDRKVYRTIRNEYEYPIDGCGESNHIVVGWLRTVG